MDLFIFCYRFPRSSSTNLSDMITIRHGINTNRISFRPIVPWHFPRHDILSILDFQDTLHRFHQCFSCHINDNSPEDLPFFGPQDNSLDLELQNNLCSIFTVYTDRTFKLFGEHLYKLKPEPG